MTQTIFVAGATGLQGGAVVCRLISNSNSKIHALVRDPTSQASQALQALSSNIKLFTGNFDDLASISAATTSCTAAFLNVTPVFTDPSGEARHAQNLVTACTDSKVNRVIYSSSSGMHTPLDGPVWTEFVPNNPNDWMTIYMKSKKACEDTITGAKFADGWCIVRGSQFMTNILPPHSAMMYPQLSVDQTITTALRWDYVMSFLDPEDLGKYAADLLISDSDRWTKFKSQIVPFGVQNMTFKEFIEAANVTLENAGSEKRIKVIQLCKGEAERRAAQGDIFVSSQIFLNKYHKAFSDGELIKAGIDGKSMTSVPDFFEKKKKELLAVVGGA